MVTQTSRSTLIPNCSVRDLYNRIYADPVALQHYHADVNHASNVSVEPWLDDKRTVRFTISVALPAVIKKAIGVDAIPVTEVQHLDWQLDGSFTVKSTPIVGIMMGSNYVTRTCLTVCSSKDQPSTTCQVSSEAECSAAGPWGLVATIEGIMAREAQASMTQFLDYCAAECTALRFSLPQGEEVGVPASPTRTDPGSELFYDPMERSMSGAASTVGGAADEGTTQRLRDQLASIEIRMAGLQQEVASAKQALLAASGPLPPPAPSQGHSASFWLATGVVAILACAGGAAMFRHYRPHL